MEGATSVAAGATIGPDTTLMRRRGGRGGRWSSHPRVAERDRGRGQRGPVRVPAAGHHARARRQDRHLRRDQERPDRGRSQGPHLTYAGDTQIGDGANIGAGAIFANYDGVTKTTSTVGRHSFVGSDSVLVHPVTIADGAYVAAGSTITGPTWARASWR